MNGCWYDTGRIAFSSVVVFGLKRSSSVVPGGSVMTLPSRDAGSTTTYRTDAFGVIRPDGGLVQTVSRHDAIGIPMTADQTLSRKVTEYGATTTVCENASGWAFLAGLSVGELFTKDGETFVNTGIVGNNDWVGHRIHAITKIIIRTVDALPAGTVVAVGTEIHLVQRLDAESDKDVRSLDPLICPCSTMFRIDDRHLAWTLENLVEGNVVNQIAVDPDTAHWARVALERMLSIT